MRLSANGTIVCGLLTQYCDNFISPDTIWESGTRMKVGCGVVEKKIRRNRYLYFWCFQGRGTGVRKIERYMGPATLPDVRRRALDEIEAYAARAKEEFEDRIAHWRRTLGRT